jgi:hypothetical protein
VWAGDDGTIGQGLVRASRQACALRVLATESSCVSEKRREASCASGVRLGGSHAGVYIGAGCPGSLNRGACGRDLRAKFARARRQLGSGDGRGRGRERGASARVGGERWRGGRVELSRAGWPGGVGRGRAGPFRPGCSLLFFF